MHDSARPFSRLQSTHKPSPSGEGISLAVAAALGYLICLRLERTRFAPEIRPDDDGRKRGSRAKRSPSDGCERSSAHERQPRHLRDVLVYML